VRAALESIAFQTVDIFDLMTRIVGQKPRYLKVDGGAAANPYLMQFQADLLGIPILRTDRTESTAWGAAKLAGMGAGFWKDVKKIDRARRYERFSSRMSSSERIVKIKSWRACIQRLLTKSI
jgi:glycerol kinase